MTLGAPPPPRQEVPSLLAPKRCRAHGLLDEAWQAEACDRMRAFVSTLPERPRWPVRVWRALGAPSASPAARDTLGGATPPAAGAIPKEGRMNWIKQHGPAVIALAGAVGAFVGAADPAFVADSAPVVGGIGAAVGLVGAVVHAYVQGATGSGN